jgi:hypothetical protein
MSVTFLWELQGEENWLSSFDENLPTQSALVGRILFRPDSLG